MLLEHPTTAANVEGKKPAERYMWSNKENNRIHDRISGTNVVFFCTSFSDEGREEKKKKHKLNLSEENEKCSTDTNK